jgi:perosamine synthetase
MSRKAETKLAILGGDPVIKKEFPSYNSIGTEEIKAVTRVVKSGILSAFYGSHHPNFYGGKEVRSFEKKWAEYFHSHYAVSINSATSGLYAAVGALGIGPGDEVIVPPYTMCASVTSVLMYNAIPVFADIESETFGLDPNAVEKAITKRTKAIIVVHLFGHMAKIDEILTVAKKHKLKVIEDCAQSPGAIDNGRFAGKLGDIGVFSLNCHKTINSGEGGVCICRDEEIYKRLMLIRNHAEAVIGGGFKVNNLVNMLGFNFRMGEMEAAISSEQLKKLDSLNNARNELSQYLTEKLKNLEGLTTPSIREKCKHVWYIYPLKVDQKKLGISRNLFVQALAKEGVPFYPGYTQPLYLLPLFRRKIAFGKDGCPFSCNLNRDSKVSYQKGLCPKCEQIENFELISSDCIRPPITFRHIDAIYKSFVKVIDNLHELKSIKDKDTLKMPVDPAARRKMFRNK